MEDHRFISRSDSSVLYGIAIILMVFHHLFCIPSRLHCEYVPTLISYDIEARVAWIGKLCVAIFAFISGYALAVITSQKVEKNIWKRLCCDIRIAAGQMIKLYRKFWVVFLVFVPIGIVFYNAPSDPKSLLKGFFLGQGGYCVEWWYLFQYLKFMCAFPLLDAVVCLMDEKRHGRAIVVFCTGLGLCLYWLGCNRNIGIVLQFAVNHLVSAYMCIFAVAFLIGKYRIYERVRKLHSITYMLILIACLIIRWNCISEPSQCNIDIILAPFVVFSMVGLIEKDSKISKVLRYFGRYSSYMWLVHTFWIYYYWQKVVLLPRYSILIFIWTVLLCLMNGILLNCAEGTVQKAIARLRM